jgi:peptidoglycan-associated lipoprotein
MEQIGFKMKKVYQWILMACTAVFSFTGCEKNASDCWGGDQNKPMKEKSTALWGQEAAKLADEYQGPQSEDFIPLRDDDLKMVFSDGAIPQPKETPGEEGSALPGIAHFSEPKGILSGIFRNLYFNTDDHILRGRDSLEALDRMAGHLKEHPHLYVFVEGHCDERGPEAYNLSLGARRANYVRSMLVQKGISPERVHTISYGKERPAVLGHTSEAWSKNRRTEFKIYNKS